MDPKLKNLDVNSSADEIGEYIDRFNFWIDTKETSDVKAIKSAFQIFGVRQMWPIGLYIQSLPRRNENVFETEEITQVEVLFLMPKLNQSPHASESAH